MCVVAPVGGLGIAEAKNVLAQHQQLAGGRAVDGGDHIQQRGLARTGRPHQGHEFAAADLDGDVVERLDLESVALEDLADVAGLHHFGLDCGMRNGSCAHDCPLILILSPSFKFCGAVVITSSPPFRPSTRTPPLRWAMHLYFPLQGLAVEGQEDELLAVPVARLRRWARTLPAAAELVALGFVRQEFHCRVHLRPQVVDPDSESAL